MNSINAPKTGVMFKQRYLGIVFLVSVQLIVGLVHVVFGFASISGNFSFSAFSSSMVYSVYTLVYGCLVVFFTYLVWKGKRTGWIGTVAISVFVIVVDSLAVFGLSNVLGISAPKFAAMGEIPFSILVLAYLLQQHVREKYNV